MDVFCPTTLDEALDARARRPDALVLAGGTDAMIVVNAGLAEVPAVVALRGVTELRTWTTMPDKVRIGAGVTYTDLATPELGALVPALAQAARTVGSPPIRNAGTIGGNVVTASPAGDTLPVLIALDAEVEVAGPGGMRTTPLSEFITGAKRTALAPEELLVAVHVPTTTTRQEYRKVGVRNAMVIAVASVALVVDEGARTVACGLGSVGPGPLRAPEAEAWIADRIDWDAVALDDPSDAIRFAGMVTAAARPIDDHRSTAAYRRHAVGVLARRSLLSALAA